MMPTTIFEVESVFFADCAAETKDWLCVGCDAGSDTDWLWMFLIRVFKYIIINIALTV